MIALTVNGKKRQVDADPGIPLLWVLRDNLGITSVKYTCGIAECGICTVLIDGEAERSCIVSVEDILQSEITTIEGLAKNGALHPIQKAFVQHGGFQCGYCTPGMILKAYSLLIENPKPSKKEIMEGIEEKEVPIAVQDGL